MPTQHRVLAPAYLDYDSAETFQTALDGAVCDVSAEVVVVDCRELDFVDSYGLRVLLSAVHQLDVDGRRLRMMNLSESIRHTFELAGLTGILHDLRSRQHHR